MCGVFAKHMWLASIYHMECTDKWHDAAAYQAVALTRVASYRILRGFFAIEHRDRLGYSQLHESF